MKIKVLAQLIINNQHVLTQDQQLPLVEEMEVGDKPDIETVVSIATEKAHIFLSNVVYRNSGYIRYQGRRFTKTFEDKELIIHFTLTDPLAHTRIETLTFTARQAFFNVH